jgi:crotonobetainyl-CoA:carnitine CoA-transferase CaiB-like acyl-CoA transferase
MSGYYAQQNAGKRNVSIDLNVPGARELALRLYDMADVVVETSGPEPLAFLGWIMELSRRGTGA